MSFFPVLYLIITGFLFGIVSHILPKAPEKTVGALCLIWFITVPLFIGYGLSCLVVDWVQEESA